MEDFVVRMVEEENELKQIIYKTTKRMDKLRDFAEKVAEGKVKLTDTEKCLLSTQAGSPVMSRSLMVLLITIIYCLEE